MWETRLLGEFGVRLRVGLGNSQVFYGSKLILPSMSMFIVGISSAGARLLRLGVSMTQLLVSRGTGPA